MFWEHWITAIEQLLERRIKLVSAYYLLSACQHPGFSHPLLSARTYAPTQTVANWLWHCCDGYRINRGDGSLSSHRMYRRSTFLPASHVQNGRGIHMYISALNTWYLVTARYKHMCLTTRVYSMHVKSFLVAWTHTL